MASEGEARPFSATSTCQNLPAAGARPETARLEMKVTSLALVTLLLVALWMEAHSFSFDRKRNTCCYASNFVKKPISPQLIRSDRPTGRRCSRQAVIVMLQRGKEVCVDPSAEWFKTYKENQKNSLKKLGLWV
nr:C-C motif chemokine 3-like [Chelonoidis abingdonii]